MVFWIALGVLGLDRLTKHLIVGGLDLYESYPVIEGVFHITYIRNPGAAFGLLAHKTPLFIGITVAVVVILAVFSRRLTAGRRLPAGALGLLLGGALGNLYDRIVAGTVVDFLDFRIWPVFNLADTAIVVGVFLFAYYLFFLDKPEKETV
ncbi:MAG: signal peptidase II [bacterium]|jgi:signal peptidase II